MRKKKSKKVTKKRSQKTYRSLLFPRLTIMSLLGLLLFGIFFQRSPTIKLQSNIQTLPKTLTLRREATPTQTVLPEKKPHALIAKALADDSKPQEYCINVPILFYHHVQPIAEAMVLGHAQFTVDSEIFRTQMEYLKANTYTAVSLDSIVDAIINRRSLPSKPIALTFDDGFADMYQYAYPLLKQYGFIGNFAIPTGLLGATDYMTWDQVTEIARDQNMRVYNHSFMHAGLKYISKDDVSDEIAIAQKDIQEKLGLRSNIFVYPFGEYNQQVLEELRSHGYIAAASTLPGILQCESELMFLRRIRIGNVPLSFYGL